MSLRLNGFLATAALVISSGALAQAKPAQPASPPAAQKAVPPQPTTTTTTTTATHPLAATPQSTAPGQTQSAPGQMQTTPGQASEMTPATTGQTPSGQTVPNAAAAKPVVTAATSADLKTGVSVYDQKGDLVGTIEKVDGDNAVVSTGSARASIALSSFGKSDQGLVISMTKGELNAAAKKKTK